ncbi:MAG: polyhydroxybutyrate depolymerase [Rhodobacteraceae bacterium]|nr:polyhydroxybutyrate depolymerase [Paracoccaceae bacterium]
MRRAPLRAAIATALAIGMSAAAPAAADCGPAPGACTLAEGQYHLVLPQRPENAGIVVFLHGAGGSGAGVVKNAALVSAIVARGYAVLAPDAGTVEGRDLRGLWNFYPGWQGRDEAAFLGDAVADAATTHGLNRDRVLLAGFSAGGFMVSYLACAEPGRFAAYAPVAGGFWRPHPADCTGPVRLLHTHGWSDTTVPIEGRPLRNGQFVQGDIFAGLEIWRRANSCADMRPDRISATGTFWRRAWTDCATGSALELAVFAGGHRIPADWPDMAIDWFEKATAGAP